MTRPTGDRGDAVVVAAVIGGICTIIAAVLTVWLTGALKHDGGGGGGGSQTPSISIPGGGGEVALFLSKESAPGGATVLVSGHGFAPSESIVVRVHTFQVASTKADGQGMFSKVAIVIPTELSKFAPQQFDVSATGQNSSRTAQAPITVSG